MEIRASKKHKGSVFLKILGATLARGCLLMRQLRNKESIC